MNSIHYIEVEVEINPRDPWADLLTEEMGELGFESFENTREGVKAYIREDLFEEEKIQQLSIPEDVEKVVSLNYRWKRMDSQNWNKEWEKNFQPVEISKDCYIRAPFHENKPQYKYQVVIEPKMSFGTGHHPTTALMAEWIMDSDFNGKQVLDMGCGTGVLGILAAMKGAEKVLGIDNFPLAVENAIENVMLNNTSNVMSVFNGDATMEKIETYDIILANITRNVLIEDMPNYSEYLRENGFILLSGFLIEDIHLIENSGIKNGFKTTGLKQTDEWAALKMNKI